MRGPSQTRAAVTEEPGHNKSQEGHSALQKISGSGTALELCCFFGGKRWRKSLVTAPQGLPLRGLTLVQPCHPACKHTESGLLS
ncbi:hypothetical protein CB1_000548024 [Camelus ferus]|nr:hypothetical protein CB1_000548024 [Camelus ferus]